ncbi:SIR2 family NAD-dependent protein deacylase [Candidatus Poriferisocius sp.]|uniref:SIR2 family NAD-dependent protein deacylase n=1 Tax=Candidatus Poriferisocius sp. TaxID=3101276 RepID=UPI003B0177F2
MRPIEELDGEIAAARAVLRDAQRVVVLTGAGISTDSGIPDFRGPEGLWTKNPEAEKTATLSSYVSDPELRQRNWQRLAEGSMWEGKAPNPGHRALVELERQEKLHLLITQNVDGLHRAAGTSEGRLVEIHGTTSKVRCLDCGDTAPMERALERVRAGEADPPCRRCGGILKSATISFGQNLVMADLHRSEQAAMDCDVMLAVGSTLTVYPIANVVPIAHQAGAAVVIVNAEPTPFDGLAAAVVPASISEALPLIVAP